MKYTSSPPGHPSVIPVSSYSGAGRRKKNKKTLTRWRHPSVILSLGQTRKKYTHAQFRHFGSVTRMIRDDHPTARMIIPMHWDDHPSVVLQAYLLTYLLTKYFRQKYFVEIFSSENVRQIFSPEIRRRNIFSRNFSSNIFFVRNILSNIFI